MWNALGLGAVWIFSICVASWLVYLISKEVMYLARRLIGGVPKQRR